MADQPSDKAIQRMRHFVGRYCEKSGTKIHPDKEISEAVILGLAQNVDEVGRPLCPCRFYPSKSEEVKHRTWICACDDMQIYKYCHCLLFLNDDGLPITEYLPEEHEGRKIYGLVEDSEPDKGRPLRDKWQEREKDREERPS